MKADRFILATVAILAVIALSISSVAQLAMASPPVQQSEPHRVDTLPDLVVEAIIIDPPTPAIGEKPVIKPVIKNLGDAAASGFSIHLYVDPADDPLTPSTVATNNTFFGLGLAAGDTFDGYTFSNYAFTKPDWKVCAWVDRGNTVAESNEENNILCVVSPLVGNLDPYEPDNVCTDAKEILADQPPQERNLFRAGGVEDVDWVKLTAKSGGRYTVEAIPVGKDADVYVELHATCDTPPSFGNAGVKITFTAPTDGVYYLKIGSTKANYGPENDYKLKLSAEETCSTQLEPNDICALPSHISVGTGPQTDSFCSTGDIDWARFEVKAGATYKVEAKNVGSRANVQLSRYNNCQGEVSESGQVMEFTASAPGFAYLKAQNLDPNVHGPGTDYTIEVTGSGGCDVDRLEPDNLQANAQPMSIDGNPLRHNICPAGDVDWVKFTAVADRTYTVETLNLGPDADTVLCLYNAAGEKIRCDDDSGPGLGSRLIIENAVAGDYFFKINDNDPEVAGARVQYDAQVITGLCKKDNFEPNNSLSTARPFPPNGTIQTHNICDAGDEDWVTFNATANTSYVISTTVIGPNADPEIELYDAAGTLLARNDDHSPGASALLVYNFTAAGAYYVKVQHFNPLQYGTGTEYGISIRPGTVTVTPTPTPPRPPNNDSSQAQQTGVRTLILVNRARMVQLFGETSTAALMAKLEQLARNEIVKGEIIRLDNNTNVSAAYATWTQNSQSLTSVDNANKVATEIRRLIITYLSERKGVEYVVMVGDDRALPLRRVRDHTTKQPEETYIDVDPTHPTGAAIRANYYLTDDYYVDYEPTPHKDREIYIPDLAIGRLIEAPADMIAIIEAFLANPVTTVENVLVTGYDFVQDSAQADCRDWQKALGDQSKIACLIGSTWTQTQFQNLQFRQTPPFKIQSINGHAAHYIQGAPVGGDTSASDVLAAGMDLSGGLIYTLACHGGLNVPPTNSVNPLDLPEAFVRKRANYVGNTGYGWGLLNSIGLSEKVIRLFTKELLRGEQVPMGKALMRAKNLYFDQDQSISVFDEKVLQQFVFYGLPMFEVSTKSPLSLGSEFPGVGFGFDNSGVLSDGVFTKTLSIDFNRILDPDDQIGNLDSFSSESGSYLSLFDSISADVGEPVQPLHFGNITVPNAMARSVLIMSATISKTIEDFDPLIGTPVNEYVPRSSADEGELAVTGGWYPPLPTGVRSNNGKSNLVTQLGQYNGDTDQLRLFSDLDVQVIFSTSSDQTPPEILVVDGLYDANSKRVNVKVGVIDTSGVKEVVASYIEDERLAATSIQSVKLTFEASSQKWRGSFPGDENSVFFIQAVDNAGNVAAAVNKGKYYRPAQSRSSSSEIYLPLISR